MPLRRTKDLTSWYTIAAIDTDVGTIYDFYFDDQQWVIRYIVVGTGVIFPGRKVLISPLALRYPAWSPMHIYVNLTREQIETSPSIDLHKPVSRRHEVEHHKHYGWPCYWQVQVLGARGKLQKRSRMLPVPIRRLKLRMCPKTRICEARRRPLAITSKRLTVKSAIWKISCLTMRLGTSGMQSLTPRIGGLARRSY